MPGTAGRVTIPVKKSHKTSVLRSSRSSTKKNTVNNTKTYMVRPKGTGALETRSAGEVQFRLDLKGKAWSARVWRPGGEPDHRKSMSPSVNIHVIPSARKSVSPQEDSHGNVVGDKDFECLSKKHGPHPTRNGKPRTDPSAGKGSISSVLHNSCVVLGQDRAPPLHALHRRSLSSCAMLRSKSVLK